VEIAGVLRMRRPEATGLTSGGRGHGAAQQRWQCAVCCIGTTPPPQLLVGRLFLISISDWITDHL
jgi:hypothetical protein